MNRKKFIKILLIVFVVVFTLVCASTIMIRDRDYKMERRKDAFLTQREYNLPIEEFVKQIK